jgi:hypothetical protein
MPVEEIRRNLERARENLTAALSALAAKHRGGEWDRYRAAQAECISLERELARATGEDCAVEIPWQYPWEVGAPLPHVLSSGAKTLVMYNVREPDPTWDGSTASIVHPASSDLRLIAIVEFERCLAHKFGSPNDEVLHGHPLHGRGLVSYAAHVVERSRFIAELMKINSVHPQYAADGWKHYRHYVLAFHDQTFECIARAHSFEQALSTFSEALELCCRKLLA